ncbi:permease [Stakelama marina]|uniref:Permease n=1 Tax=Stakelama marina TaxID=2826939 RepID=A0A8T4IG07_9SPHN|nr:permease [Stakelama marina]MBR0553391.1 permease [Stakelama marina]
MNIVEQVGTALLMALGMFWKTGWTLVLGFAISAVLQTIVPADAMREKLGRHGAKQVALATILGAASSSCSFAAASVSRTLFKKGASLVTSLTFLFAATNLVIELGVILYLLMGWEFMAAEWLGGIALIGAMSLIVTLTYPKKLAEEARNHPEPGGGGHDHGAAHDEGGSWIDKLKRPETRGRIAQAFTMEWGMLWKDLAIGFLIGGFVSVFVPTEFWQSLFLVNAPEWVRVPFNAAIGPIIAMLTFVCSIGNVPVAAVLWGGGATFGGVIAFLYGDLIVLPLIDVYRRYYGWRMALYIALVLFASMVIAAIGVDLAFSWAGLVPQAGTDIREELTTFAIDYTFWLNLVFGAIGLWLWRLSRKAPEPKKAHCCH